MGENQDQKGPQVGTQSGNCVKALPTTSVVVFFSFFLRFSESKYILEKFNVSGQSHSHTHRNVQAMFNKMCLAGSNWMMSSITSYHKKIDIFSFV